MSTASAPQVKRQVNEVLTDAVRARAAATTQSKVQQKEEDARFASIQSNEFFKVVFNTALTPDQKRAELTKALTYAGTKIENRERVKAFELFKEYLSHVREEMASEIIRLTNTEAFSELQSVYNDLSNDLNTFDENMKPLTDILDALYELRTNNATFDAIKEIQKDREHEAEFTKKRTDCSNLIGDATKHIDELNEEILLLSEERGFLGIGGIRQSAREKIALKQNEINNLMSDLEAQKTELEKLNQEDEAYKASSGKFSEAKQKLRGLLESTDHNDRQRALVASAQKFVANAKERVGSVRNHLSKMDDQIENLSDANNNMTTIFAIMNEGVKDASLENQKLRGTLQAPEGTEDTLVKVQREQKLQDVDQFIATLDNSARDTMTTYADLSTQAVRIKSMKDANVAQVDKARMLHTQGIAGVADRLSIVLQAVSGAALGESSAMAKDTLQRMTDNTNRVAQKEAIRVATGIDEINADVIKAIDDLGAYGEVVATATNIQREGLKEMRENLAKLREAAADNVDKVRESISVNAEVGSDASPVTKSKVEEPTFKSPFGA